MIKIKEKKVGLIVCVNGTDLRSAFEIYQKYSCLDLKKNLNKFTKKKK